MDVRAGNFEHFSKNNSGDVTGGFPRSFSDGVLMGICSQMMTIIKLSNNLLPGDQ